MRGFFEVRCVGLLGIFIPFRGEHALPTYCLKGESSTADPGEEVYEAEGHRPLGAPHAWPRDGGLGRATYGFLHGVSLRPSVPAVWRGIG